MNKSRRVSLKEAMELLDRAASIVSDVLDDEQDSMDNLPENLQASELYESMENAIQCLEDAMERIDEAKDSIDSAAT